MYAASTASWLTGTVMPSFHLAPDDLGALTALVMSWRRLSLDDALLGDLPRTDPPDRSWPRGNEGALSTPQLPDSVEGLANLTVHAKFTFTFNKYIQVINKYGYV